MPSIEARYNANGELSGYRIYVSNGIKKDGKQIRYTFIWTPSGKTSSARAMLQEATAAAYKYEQEIKVGFHTNEGVVFEDYAAYVMGVKEQSGVRPTTLEGYFTMLPTINKAIGYLPLTKIRPDILNNFYAQLLQTNKKSTTKVRASRNLMNLLDERGISNQKLAKAAQLSASTVGNAVRGDLVTLESAEAICKALEVEMKDIFAVRNIKTMLSPKTVLEYHRLISTIFHQAEKEMIIMYNPASRATPPKATASNPDYYQPDQMTDILNALEDAPLRWKAITYVMIGTGCRRGEVMGLKWESVDLETGLMVVENNLQYTKKTGLYLGATKTGKIRALKLAPPVIEVLKKWKTEQLKLKLKKGPDWHETGMVFTLDDGSWMHPDSATKWLKKFSEEKGLPHIHPHAFRHTAASTMIANGVDLVTTANELGHANATTTAKIYAHQIALAAAKAAEVRAGVFYGRENNDNKPKGSKLRSKYRGA